MPVGVCGELGKGSYEGEPQVITVCWHLMDFAAVRDGVHMKMIVSLPR